MLLKTTDVFETSNKSGMFQLRIVDAKFALPKSHDGDENDDFICLDIPEYASEHDDITITFDDEEGEFGSHAIFMPHPLMPMQNEIYLLAVCLQ